MLKIFFATLFALVFNQGVYIFGLSMTSPIDASIVTTTLPIVTMIVAAIYLSGTGSRFGMVQIAAYPPFAAASVPVLTVSLYEKPGSRR